MRATVLVSLIALSSAGPVQAQPRKTTQGDFLIGQVTSSLGAQIEIDLGYVHGFRINQRLAVFRSEPLAWSPIGVVETIAVDSSRSKVRIASGARPRQGDVVLVAQSTLGYMSNKHREKFYSARRILRGRFDNRYDTRDLAVDARQLSGQKLTSRRWYRKGEATGIRITFGTSKDAYESEKVRSLASQCDLLREFQIETPGAMKSLSARWKQVLPEITGYVEPPAKPEEGEASNKVEDDEFADVEVARNMLPLVDREYQDEPKALREILAVILGAVSVSTPANTRAYIGAQLRRSQFPQVADQPESLRNFEEFISRVQ